MKSFNYIVFLTIASILKVQAPVNGEYSPYREHNPYLPNSDQSYESKPSSVSNNLPVLAPSNLQTLPLPSYRCSLPLPLPSYRRSLPSTTSAVSSNSNEISELDLSTSASVNLPSNTLQGLSTSVRVESMNMVGHASPPDNIPAVLLNSIFRNCFDYQKSLEERKRIFSEQFVKWQNYFQLQINEKFSEVFAKVVKFNTDFLWPCNCDDGNFQNGRVVEYLEYFDCDFQNKKFSELYKKIGDFNKEIRNIGRENYEICVQSAKFAFFDDIAFSSSICSLYEMLFSNYEAQIHYKYDSLRFAVFGADESMKNRLAYRWNLRFVCPLPVL